MNDFANRLFDRFGAFRRYLTLRHQLGVVEKLIANLSPSERVQLIDLTARDIGQRAPSEDLEAAFARARSENVHLRLHGISQWLGIVYRETRDSRHDEVRDLHREIMRTLRLLRESVSRVARVA
jgi:hypothetical protein